VFHRWNWGFWGLCRSAGTVRRVDRCEIFDEAVLDAALARFGELSIE
jgi:hypothetical protein